MVQFEKAVSLITDQPVPSSEYLLSTDERLTDEVLYRPFIEVSGGKVVVGDTDKSSFIIPVKRFPYAWASEDTYVFSEYSPEDFDKRYVRVHLVIGKYNIFMAMNALTSHEVISDTVECNRKVGRRLLIDVLQNRIVRCVRLKTHPLTQLQEN